LLEPAGSIPATGKTVTISYMNFIRLRNGVAVETWTQQDLLGMLSQLGVLSAPGPSPA
jgi:predicted ester cyclase